MLFHILRGVGGEREWERSIHQRHVSFLYESVDTCVHIYIPYYYVLSFWRVFFYYLSCLTGRSDRLRWQRGGRGVCTAWPSAGMYCFILLCCVVCLLDPFQGFAFLVLFFTSRHNTSMIFWEAAKKLLQNPGGTKVVIRVCVPRGRYLHVTNIIWNCRPTLTSPLIPFFLLFLQLVVSTVAFEGGGPTL